MRLGRDDFMWPAIDKSSCLLEGVIFDESPYLTEATSCAKVGEKDDTTKFFMCVLMLFSYFDM